MIIGKAEIKITLNTLGNYEEVKVEMVGEEEDFSYALFDGMCQNDALALAVIKAMKAYLDRDENGE